MNNVKLLRRKFTNNDRPWNKIILPKKYEETHVYKAYTDGSKSKEKFSSCNLGHTSRTVFLKESYMHTAEMIRIKTTLKEIYDIK